MLIENDVEIETGAAISSASWLVPAVPVLCRLTYIYWFVCAAGVFFFVAVMLSFCVAGGGEGMEALGKMS